MSTPFFSVIIPTLNEEDYLPRLLDDLVNQKDTSYEVMVVDGGSNDNTVKIAKGYLSKLKMNLLFNQEKNVSQQRNLGAQTAKGRYLVFLDADVQIKPEYLYYIHQAINRHKSVFLTTYFKADSKNKYDRLMAQAGSFGMLMTLAIEKPFVPGYNFIILKEIFYHLGGFKINIKHGEDYDLSYRLYQAGCKVRIIKRPYLTCCLRRYRQEGRLSVIRKNAQSALHMLTKGPITKDIFFYPMGGGWYKQIQKISVPKQDFLWKNLLKKFLNFT